MPRAAYDCTLTRIIFGTNWCKCMCKYTIGKHTDAIIYPSRYWRCSYFHTLHSGGAHWYLCGNTINPTQEGNMTELNPGRKQNNEGFCLVCTQDGFILSCTVTACRTGSLQALTLLKGWNWVEQKWDGDGWLDKPRKGVKECEDGEPWWEMRGIMRRLVSNREEKGGWKDKRKRYLVLGWTGTHTLILQYVCRKSFCESLSPLVHHTAVWWGLLTARRSNACACCACDAAWLRLKQHCRLSVTDVLILFVLYLYPSFWDPPPPTPPHPHSPFVSHFVGFIKNVIMPSWVTCQHQEVCLCCHWLTWCSMWGSVCLHVSISVIFVSCFYGEAVCQHWHSEMQTHCV